jgi:hypothetical protein
MRSAAAGIRLYARWHGVSQEVRSISQLLLRKNPARRVE